VLPAGLSAMLDFAKKNPKQIIKAVPHLAKRERSLDCLEEMKGKDFRRTKKGGFED
jgi:hypothetical protein